MLAQQVLTTCGQATPSHALHTNNIQVNACIWGARYPFIDLIWVRARRSIIGMAQQHAHKQHTPDHQIHYNQEFLQNWHHGVAGLLLDAIPLHANALHRAAIVNTSRSRGDVGIACRHRVILALHNPPFDWSGVQMRLMYKCLRSTWAKWMSNVARIICKYNWCQFVPNASIMLVRRQHT